MGMDYLNGLVNCVATADSQKSNQQLGKVVELGKEYSLIFRKRNGYPVVAGITGRNCNYDVFKMSFVRIPEGKLEQIGTSNSYRDTTIAARWAIISDLLYKAAKAKDIEDAKADAKKAADMAGVPIDELALSQAIEKIEIAYEGRRASEGVAAIPPTKKRLINSRGNKVEINYHSECVVVPLDKNMQPEYDKARVAGIQLGYNKLHQLLDFANNPAYNDMDDKDGFLEIRFSCTGTDKKVAMRNSFVGVEKAVRKFDFTRDEEGGFLDSGTASIANKLYSIAFDYDTMRDRSQSATFSVTPADLDAAMRKYLAANRVLPLYLDLTDESVTKHAKTILELGCIFRKDSKQYNELKEIMEKNSNEVDEAAENVGVINNGDAIKEAADATDVRQAVENIDSAGLSDIVSDEVDDI